MTKIPKLLTAVLAGACLLGAASLAPAGNHLKCYKGKDSTGAKHKYSGGVLASNTGLLTESGCRIATPPKICCDAVDKIGFLDEGGMPPPGGGPTGNTTRFYDAGGRPTGSDLPSPIGVPEKVVERKAASAVGVAARSAAHQMGSSRSVDGIRSQRGSDEQKLGRR